MYWPCLLIVQLISQLESRQVTIPPVTTLPEYGLLLVIFSMYFAISLLLTVTVADSQLVLSTSEANTSGLPKSSDFLAIFFHSLKLSSVFSSFIAGVSLLP